MRDIKNYEGLYAVTSCGKVWGYKRKKFLKPYVSNDSYYGVALCKDGIAKGYLIHRLVAEAYLSNPDNLPEVNHKNEKKDKNYVNNLEWCTHYYNLTYGTRSAKAAKAISDFRRANPYKSNVKAVYCVELDKTYDTIKEAAEELSVDSSDISACCKGKLKTAGKYHWQYSDN